jgi:quinol monooxygenase YgiN
VALVLVKMNVLAEKRKEVWQTINSLAVHMKTAKGCEGAGFYQNSDDDGDILFLTTWADRDALDAYLKSFEFMVLVGTRSLLSKEPTIWICADESLFCSGG